MVEAQRGDIFDAQYLELLREVNDALFYMPGVDRNRMRSLWTPNVRWTEVTEEGFEGDKVIDSRYDGSDQASMERLRTNILRSGEVGRLVAGRLPLEHRRGAPVRSRPGAAASRWITRQFSELLETEHSRKISRASWARISSPRYPHRRVRQDGRRPHRRHRAIFLFAVITLVVTALLLSLLPQHVRGYRGQP